MLAYVVAHSKTGTTTTQSLSETSNMRRRLSCQSIYGDSKKQIRTMKLTGKSLRNPILENLNLAHAIYASRKNCPLSPATASLTREVSSYLNVIMATVVNNNRPSRTHACRAKKKTST